MDRPLVYVHAIPRSADFLGFAKSTMIALGMTLQAVLGSSTFVDGLACSPTSPASMQVSIGQGSILSVAPVDASAYGGLAADTINQVVKQGIQLGSQLYTLAAPSTSGYSQNYLISAAFAEVDVLPVALPYQNTAPGATSSLNGPDGLGTQQNTVRQGQCVITVTPGVAAPSGSQATPATPNGATPLYVITVQNGQTTITSPNISTVSGAPFIGDKLTAKLSQSTADSRYLRQSNNLSDLQSLATAVSNLGFSKSFGSSGNQKWPGGLTLMWGTVAMAQDSTSNITFPFAFTTALMSASAAGTINRISSTQQLQTAINVNSTSATGMTLSNDDNAQNVFWLAWGY